MYRDVLKQNKRLCWAWAKNANEKFIFIIYDFVKKWRYSDQKRTKIAFKNY